jgi:hypothetical protein
MKTEFVVHLEKVQSKSGMSGRAASVEKSSKKPPRRDIVLHYPVYTRRCYNDLSSLRPAAINASPAPNRFP